MRIVDIIERKRDGFELSAEEIETLVSGYTSGDVPDYQAAAWLMAVYCRGLSERETADLTWILARSGQIIDWPGLPFVVDKHSTGGVGDKTSLVVCPMVAAAGVPVAKMSGRGLGHTGGTLDKLESIPGLKVKVPVPQLQKQVERVRLAIVAQSADLAPADGKLYALRDVTGTVSSLPLIASSVMSKKIAGGANGIVLDVKTGRGAFAQTVEDATTLSRMMIHLGQACGRRVRAVISRMDQPLGNAVGNALEVQEAIATLRGEGPDDLFELCLTLASQMLLIAGHAKDEESARAALLSVIQSGAALSALGDMVAAQEGDRRVLDDPGRLPRAAVVRTITAPVSGTIHAIDARAVGQAVVRLGGGRQRKEDAVDPSVGVVFKAKVGATVAKGDPLFELHAASATAADDEAKHVLAAFTFGEDPIAPPPVVVDILR